MLRFKMLLAVVAATAMLALQASVGYAQSATEGYGGSNAVPGLEHGGTGEVAPGAAEGTAAPEDTAAPATAAVQTAVDKGGSVPFTGADLGVLAAAAGLLLALGFGLRRLTYRPTL